jgi:hypothetical protein
MHVSLAQGATSLGVPNGFFQVPVLDYPGPTTNITFENGTSTTTLRNNATVNNYKSWSGITDGDSLFTARCIPSSTNSSSPSATPTPPAPGPTVTGYPYPVIKDDANIISGYFLNDTGYEDVAVLFIPSFETNTGDGSADSGSTTTAQFTSIVAKFLDSCRAAKKQKLIIDLQANGGGTNPQGIDLFAQLFPKVTPYTGNRLRAHDALNAIGLAFASVTPQQWNNLNNATDLQNWGVLPFNYSTDVTADQKNTFKSWQNFYGPYTNGGDNHTSIFGFANFNEPDYVGMNITGYGSLKNAVKPQPFKAENIILLTDGFCASSMSLPTLSLLLNPSGSTTSRIIANICP